MEQDTKSSILEVALDLFSEYGYDGTSLQQIADRLQISKTALYRHYKSKEDIFNSIIKDVDSYYSARFYPQKKIKINSLDELFELSMQQIRFTVFDSKIIRIRKLFTLSQFRNERIAALTTQYFLTAIERLYESIFSALIENGTLKAYDPAILSFEYTATVGTLIHLCDREPQKREEALQKIQMYIKHFMQVYGKNCENQP